MAFSKRFSRCLHLLFCVFALVCPVLVSSCADEASSANRLDDSFRNFSRILSKGDSVKLEATGLVAHFTYDFYIGEHEVTQGEYFRMTGVPFAEGKENFPVTNVTFYDAALYANALSRSMKIDTVYEWTAKALDANGKCTYLDGFRTNYSANGYRLPTEAEWVYAAKNGWNSKDAGWNSENSDYALHEVCCIGKNRNGLCDMAGNALEWTGDWMSSLGDTAVTDFVGGNEPNSLDEIIVKGGSFRNAPENISLKNRGDVYTVTPSMSADYVGFRLVRGAIAIPDFADNQNQKSDYHISVLANAKTLKKKVGTFVSMLAFRDDETGNIGFVRFASSNPQAVEIPDTIDAYHPAISPDGKRVAFCTRPEGISGKSDLYVRDLDAKGSNLVKLEAESAAIPRWRVIGADTQIVYVTGVGNNSDAAEWKRGSTWTVSFSGGKFGTPEKLFDGTYNGGVSADGRLAVSGARLLRANADGKESVWYSGEQACNVSLSDTLKRTLFLDFGGETGKNFAGKSYDAHEMLLAADSSGKLSKMVPSPAGYAFDHTEWVRRRENLAVSTLTDADGAHSKIALIDVSDSSVLELAEGKELWHPDLWTSKPSSQNFELDPDSAGVYYQTGGTEPQSQMRVKMELFWNYRDSINILALGSSRILHGVIPKEISSGFAVNMGHSSNDMSLIYYMAENYALNLLPRLKALVISLDIDNWQTVEVYRDQMINGAPGYLYDANHLFWKNGVPDNFLDFVQASPQPLPGHREGLWDTYGFWELPGNGWGNPEIESDYQWAEKNALIVSLQLESLKSFLKTMKTAGIRVIGIVFPQNPKYRETESWGRYGPSRTAAVQIMDSLSACEDLFPNFILMDENKMGEHDYSDEMAQNTDHLAYRGAAQLTARLDSLLRTLK